MNRIRRLAAALAGLAGALLAFATVAPAALAQRRIGRTELAREHDHVFRRRMMIAPGLLPHTLQLCIHCQQNSAGFWVSQKRARTVRRPWCLSCCDGLDRSRCDVIPFGSQEDPDGAGRSQPRPSLL